MKRSFSKGIIFSITFLLVAVAVGCNLLSRNNNIATATSGWQTEGGVQYYYNANGVKAKGLYKIGDKNYLFDSSTGAYTGEQGEHIYLGSYFQTRNYQTNTSQNVNNEMFKMYLTLDGKHFHAIDKINNTTKTFTNDSTTVTKCRAHIFITRSCTRDRKSVV